MKKRKRSNKTFLTSPLTTVTHRSLAALISINLSLSMTQSKYLLKHYYCLIMILKKSRAMRVGNTVNTMVVNMVYFINYCFVLNVPNFFFEISKFLTNVITTFQCSL